MRTTYICGGAAAVSAFLAVPPAVAAGTDADLAARVTRLEAENAELQAEVRELRERESPSPTPTAAPKSDNPASPSIVYAQSHPTPPPRWTGLHVGVSAGYLFGHADGFEETFFAMPTLQRLSGGLVGGEAGADVQSGHIVLGMDVGAEYDGARGTQSVAGTGNISAASTCFVGPTSQTLLFGPATKRVSCNAKTGIEEQVSGRAGYVFADDQALFYLRGGVTRARLATSYSFISDQGVPALLPATEISGGAKNLIGGLFGAGLEYYPPGKLSYSAEYQFRFYGLNDFNNGYYYKIRQSPGGPLLSGFQTTIAPSTHDLNEQVVRVTVKYHLPN